MFRDFETTVKNKLESISILETLTQRHLRQEQVRRFDTNQDDCKNKNCASTYFLRIRKKQVKELKEYLEQY